MSSQKLCDPDSSPLNDAREVEDFSMRKKVLHLQPIDDSRRPKQSLNTEIREKITQQHPLNLSQNSDHERNTMQGRQSIMMDELGYKKKSTISQRRYQHNELAIQLFLSSQSVQIFIILLVGLYTLLQFVIIALEDLLTDDQLTITSIYVNWVELAILLTFILEIVSSTYAWGFKKYFKDRWLILDSTIISLSTFFVLFEITTTVRVAKSIIGILQVVFRFLRILLLIRKAQQFKKIKNVSSIKTPAEKINDFLIELKDITEDVDMKLDMDYCIDKISSNQLYEQAFFDEDDSDNDAANWIRQYGGTRIIHQDEIISPDEVKESFLTRKQSLGINRVPIIILERLKAQHDDLYINPFDLHALKDGEQGLVNLMLFLFAEHDLIEVLSTTTDCFVAFFTKIWDGYQDNPYHNKIHSFDVTQSTNFFVSKCKLLEAASLTKIDLICLYTAAAIHDYNHPGYNNQFMVNSKSELATLYNDKAVLESYHVAQSFKVMHSSETNNIFASVSKDNYRKMRESIIGIVLATDMAGHFAEIAKLKSRLGARIDNRYKQQIADYDIKGKDKQMVMEMIVHASDISNPIKNFDVYKEWTQRLFKEFWNQGDIERKRELPISYLCDRYTTNLAKAQGGFIDFVVRPMMSLLTQVMPGFDIYYQNLDINKAKWGELVDQYQLELDRSLKT